MVDYRPVNGDVSPKGDGIQITYDELVGRDGREFIFLDYVFDTGKDFGSGAVSTRMVPVTIEEFERRVEEYKDPEWSPIHHIYEEQVDNGLDKSWSTWIEEQLRIEGPHRLVMDTSYAHKYEDTVRDVCEREGIYGTEEIEAVECIGGGRMFNTIEKSDVTLYRPDLWAFAKQVEESGLQLD